MIHGYDLSANLIEMQQRTMELITSTSIINVCLSDTFYPCQHENRDLCMRQHDMAMHMTQDVTI